MISCSFSGLEPVFRLRLSQIPRRQNPATPQQTDTVMIPQVLSKGTHNHLFGEVYAGEEGLPNV